MYRCTLLACVVGLTGILSGQERGPTARDKVDSKKVQYARDIQPIFSANCFTCHGPDAKSRKAGLRLDLAEDATRTLKSGSRAIVPGDAKASELIARVMTHEDSERM